MDYTVYQLLWLFLFYSFLGWLAETVLAALKRRRLLNRGFLSAPFSPTYGLGALLFAIFLPELREDPFFLFLLGMILATFLEFVTGVFLERIFHQKWWDYSGQPFNIGGYVCLPFSLIWGVFCVFIVKCFQPLVAHLIGYIPHIVGIVILVVLSIAMIADLYVTASAILKLNKRLEAMEKIAAELREFSDRMGENIYENVKDGMEKEEQLKSKVAGMKEVRKELRAEYSAGKEEWYKSQQQKLDELKGRYDSLVNGLGSVGERLVKAFPNMESRIHKDALREVKKRVVMRRNKRK